MPTSEVGKEPTDAGGTVLGTTITWKPTPVEDLLSKVGISSKPKTSIELYPSAVARASRGLTQTGEEVSPESVYEHEAHHAIDILGPDPKQRFYNVSGQAAEVLDDLNTLRSYAATHADQELFETVNNALEQFHADPAHVNNWLAHLAALERTPEWYRKKYFAYRAATPEWQGTQAVSPKLSLQDPRLVGQVPPSNEALVELTEAAPEWTQPPPMGGGQEQKKPTSALEDALRAIIEDVINTRMGAGQAQDDSGGGDQQDDRPWWEKAKDVAATTAAGALGGAQQTAGDIFGGIQRGAQAVVTQATAPAQLEPGQESAQETITKAPQRVGEAFSARRHRPSCKQVSIRPG